VRDEKQVNNFRFGICLGGSPEDGSSGTQFTQHIINYLKEISTNYDSIWIPDHLVTFGKKDAIESMTTITYVSALFPDCKVGTAVTCNNFRNPALTAKMAATLDALTNGRFILGIGGGWYKSEYEQYGYSFPSGKVRINQLEEAVKIIKGMWMNDDFSFKGNYYEVKNVSCNPKPCNPTLMIGGGGEKFTLQLVADYADIWNVPLISPELFRQKLSILRSYCSRVGRDSDEIRNTVLCMVALADSDAEAERLAKITDLRNNPLVVGSPKTVALKFNEYIEAGVEGFINWFVPFPNSNAAVLFAEEVMPELNLP
jgi:alkanesulfonate monooxygenase SsuD/methylene tetrahydromethanopterin reductase-like flavin-dependent oxidoreductase (luciferase family)